MRTCWWLQYCRTEAANKISYFLESKYSSKNGYKFKNNWKRVLQILTNDQDNWEDICFHTWSFCKRCNLSGHWDYNWSTLHRKVLFDLRGNFLCSSNNLEKNKHVKNLFVYRTLLIWSKHYFYLTRCVSFSVILKRINKLNDVFLHISSHFVFAFHSTILKIAPLF